MSISSDLGFPFDDTGLLASNRVVEEPQTVNEKRMCVLDHGPFYATSLRIYDTENGGRRLQDDEFEPRYLYQYWSRKVGQAIYAYIELTNPEVSSNITVTYQPLGGPASYSGRLIYDLIQQLNDRKEPVDFWSIEERPTRFRPEGHLHDARYDVYGMEYIRDALDDLLKAIQTGREAPHDTLRDWYYRSAQELDGRLKEWLDLFYLHVQNVDNPHRLTALQVELEQVANWPAATTEEEVRTATPRERYLTPWGMGLLMADHLASDDHDGQYYPKAEADDTFLLKTALVGICFDGPLNVAAGGTVDLRITNYDRFSYYEVIVPEFVTGTLIPFPFGDNIGTDAVRLDVSYLYPDTDLPVTVLKNGNPRTVHLSVTPASVKTPSVSGRAFASNNGSISVTGSSFETIGQTDTLDAYDLVVRHRDTDRILIEHRNVPATGSQVVIPSGLSGLGYDTPVSIDLRYKGALLGWSEWGRGYLMTPTNPVMRFTTAAEMVTKTAVRYYIATSDPRSKELGPVSINFDYDPSKMGGNAPRQWYTFNGPAPFVYDATHGDYRTNFLVEFADTGFSYYYATLKQIGFGSAANRSGAGFSLRGTGFKADLPSFGGSGNSAIGVGETAGSINEFLS